LVLQTLTALLYQPWTIDDECGTVGGIRIGRGNRSSRRKPAPMPLCPPQIPHNMTWARTRAAVLGSRGLAVAYISSYMIELDCVTSDTKSIFVP
jgi:hypothetical protein